MQVSLHECFFCATSLAESIDLVAALGEVTAGPFIGYLRDAMLLSESGRRILRDRPRITSKALPLKELQKFPESSVGYTYAKWLADYRMSPDERDDVRYIDDEECAYVMQRYRECHDIYHAILGLPAFLEGEITLKAFELANTGLPVAGLSMFAVSKLKSEERARFFNLSLPWAVKNGINSKPIINVYWETELSTDVEMLLENLQIERPPDLRAIRKRERTKKRMEETTKEGTSMNSQ